MTLPSCTPYSLPPHYLLNFPVPLMSVTTPCTLSKSRVTVSSQFCVFPTCFSQPITLFSSRTSSRHPVHWTIQFLPIHQLFSDFILLFQFSSVQSLSCIQLFATPWTAACQASLSITNSQSLLKLMSIESVMPSNHLILCHPLLLPPSIFPSIRVFSDESVLRIWWPKYWSFGFSISSSFAL